jgi:hypothetical protein
MLAALLMTGLTACAAQGTTGPASGTAAGSPAAGRPGGASATGASPGPARPGPNSPGPNSTQGTAGSQHGSTADLLARVPAAARRIICPVTGSVLPGGSVAPPLASYSIPAGFSPVAVVECINLGQFAPGHGAGSAERKQVAVAGLGGLLASLRAAQAAPAPAGPLCIAPLKAPWFVLIGRNGQLIRPVLPATLCGKAASSPVLTSLQSLTWIDLGVTTVPPVVAQGRAGAHHVSTPLSP